MQKRRMSGASTEEVDRTGGKMNEGIFMLPHAGPLVKM